MKAAAVVHTFNCEDCQSKESYVDDQGNVCCSYCGTLSQQFFAESFDIEDGMAAVMNRGANRSKSRKKTKVAPPVRAPEADILEFLSLYQYCLLLLLRYTMRAAGLEDEPEMKIGDKHDTTSSVFDSYESTMKNIFSRYLLCWRDCSCDCSCCISDAFTKPSRSNAQKRPRPRYCMCDSMPTTTRTTIAAALKSSHKQPGGSVNKSKCHPIPLSKPLLLGFVYLTFRLQRSWVIPADIVRWCESGLVPYNTIYEVLPDSCKVDIIKENAPFFISLVPISVFISSGKIACLSESIASSLDIPMPPLNAPLVARSIIEQLGLPIEVWVYYQALAQLMLPACDGKAIDGAEAFGQHYSENIMAVIIIACKCCKDWTRWALVKRLSRNVSSSSSSVNSSSSGGSSSSGNNSSSRSGGHNDKEVFAMPMSIAEMSLMPRYQLPQLLQRVRSIVPTPMWQQPSLINGAVRAVWDRYRILQDPQHVDPSISSKSRLHWDHLTVYDSTLKQRNVVMHHTVFIYDQLTPLERKIINGLDGITKPKFKFGVKMSTLKDYCSYISYARPSKSAVTGLHHMQYLLLLERLARHLRCAPSLLHPLVDKLDGGIFISEANLTTLDADRIPQVKVKSSKHTSAAQLQKIMQARNLDKVERQYCKYKVYCDERFPIIRRYGNNRKKLSRKVLKHLILIPKNSKGDDDEFLDYISNFDNHMEPVYVPEEERIRRAKQKKIPKEVVTSSDTSSNTGKGSDTENEIEMAMNDTDSDSSGEYSVKSEYEDGDSDYDYQRGGHHTESIPYDSNLVLNPDNLTSYDVMVTAPAQPNLIDDSRNSQLAEISSVNKDCGKVHVTRCGDIISVCMHPLSCDGNDDKNAAAVSRQAKIFSQAQMEGTNERNSSILSAEADSTGTVDLLDRALSAVKVLLLPTNHTEECNYVPDLDTKLSSSAFGL